MQNPTVQRALTNPRVMQAMTQIQNGIQQLQQEAPEMLPLLGMTPSTFSTLTSQSPGNTSSASNPPSATSTASQGTTPTTTSATGSQAGSNPMFNQMFQSMLQQLGQSRSQQPPEERFRAQLEQLAAMGFVDRAANLQGLLSLFTYYWQVRLKLLLKHVYDLILS